MKEILLQYFQVKLDENGKELKEPLHHFKKDGTKVYTYENAPATIRYHEAKTVIKLPTLSEFLINTFDSEIDLLDKMIVNRAFVDFINQPLTLEQFIGEDAIFVGENIYNDLQNCHNCTIEQALNAGVTLYINPDKI